ncbi:MAG: hypothetical protein ABIV94_02640 [Acidimicrobiales bacterium]
MSAAELDAVEFYFARYAGLADAAGRIADRGGHAAGAVADLARIVADLAVGLDAERSARLDWQNDTDAAVYADDDEYLVPERDADPETPHVCQRVDNDGNTVPRLDDDGAPVTPLAVTCGRCDNTWCERCDPCPGPCCPWCNGIGYSTAPMAAP